MRVLLAFSVAAATVPTFVACGTSGGSGDTQETPSALSGSAAVPSGGGSACTITMPTHSAPAFAVCSDAQTAAFVLAINDSVIAAGKLAQQKTSDANVRAFADRMVHDHSAAQAAFRALFQQQDITPEIGDNSKQFAASAARDLTDLQGRSSSDFDRTYVAAAAIEHTLLLGLLDQIFIPGAIPSPPLHEALIGMRAVVVQHLNHALMVQTAIVGACGGGTPSCMTAGQ
jgi:putative membrane protein